MNNSLFLNFSFNPLPTVSPEGARTSANLPLLQRGDGGSRQEGVTLFQGVGAWNSVGGSFCNHSYKNPEYQI